MRRRYPNFEREMRRHSHTRRPRHPSGNGRFILQLITTAALGGVLAWTLAPEAGALFATTTTSPAGLEQVEQSAYYPNCDAARSAGAAPIYRGSAGYRDKLDRDSDGVACEPYY